MQAVWVEIPVVDLERAATFYQTVFGLPAGKIDDDGVRRTLTLFNPTEGGMGISLNQNAGFEPSDKGVYVYFRSEGDTLEKVTAAGGKVVQDKTSMGDAGTFASIQDTEGNVLGLYFLP